jgi:hypothetical protein
MAEQTANEEAVSGSGHKSLLENSGGAWVRRGRLLAMIGMRRVRVFD